MLTEIIPSYAYLQYADDADIQAFVAAFNQMAQDYLDTLNDLNLPIYTGPLIITDLLDWVAEGIYGQSRPSLASGLESIFGPLNTITLNSFPFNNYQIGGTIAYYTATDDIFKRIITWNFYKGDGAIFNIRWLKRRIARFLDGTNGVDPIVNETYTISVTFGGGNIVEIQILTGGRIITGGAILNVMGINTTVLNSVTSVFTPITPHPFSEDFKSALRAGALIVPFQYQFNVA